LVHVTISLVIFTQVLRYIGDRFEVTEADARQHSDDNCYTVNSGDEGYVEKRRIAIYWYLSYSYYVPWNTITSISM